MYPVKLSPDTVSDLLNKLDSLRLCVGNPDSRFIQLLKAKKGKIVATNGSVSAYIDGTPTELNGVKYPETVRSSKCDIIGHTVKCEACGKYRSNLRTMHNRWQKRGEKEIDISNHINDRYLYTPEKTAKMTKLRKKARTSSQGVLYLQEKVRKLCENCGNTVDESLHSDLFTIMKENREQINSTYPEGSFARLFWEEQFKAATVKDPRQMRWHPTIIKWCLNLKLISGAAYHAVGASNFIKLPSERTLRDYTNY